MAQGVRIPPEHKAKIAKLWREGVTLSAIASRFGYSVKGIQYIVKKLRKEGKLYED